MKNGQEFILRTFRGRKRGAASHPSATVIADEGYKLIGGGAVIDPVEPSNFLTASYLRDPKTPGMQQERITKLFLLHLSAFTLSAFSTRMTSGTCKLFRQPVQSCTPPKQL